MSENAAERGNPGRLIDLRTTEVLALARNTNLYRLAPVSGAMLPPASAGAHIDLHLGNGLVRQYSLILDDSAAAEYVVVVKRDPASRGGSDYIHREFRVGTTVKIGVPRNHFPLDESAGHAVLIAGGIGITPIYSMVRRLVRLGKSWELHYACRSRDDMAFADRLADLPGVHCHLDDQRGGAVLNVAGIISRAHGDAHFYCCGPAPMMAAFEIAAAGLPPDRKHLEYFSAKEAPSQSGGYVVRLARSGLSLTIPEGRTILDVVTGAGVAVEHSCTEGICGTCETKVLGGIPDHRDSVLTPAERQLNKVMMICCSGSKSAELVLDL